MNSPRDPGAAEFFAEHPWAYWLAVAGAAGGTLAFASRAVMTTSGRKRIENVTLAVMTGGELLGLLALRFGRKSRSTELAKTPPP